MKRAFLAVVAMLLVTASSGCLHQNIRPNQQAQCSGGGCEGLLGGLFGGQLQQGMNETHGWRHQAPQMGPPGPPTGTYAYPYYTLHGPRDFLVDNPPSLGN